MNRPGRLALAGALALALGGCAPRDDERATAPIPPRAPLAPDSAAAGTRVVERARGAPGDAVEGHALYRVEWPDSTRLPGHGALADSVAAAIAWAVAEGQPDAAGRPLPADSLAARFLAGHAEFRRSFPQGPAEWFIRRTITLETLPFGLTTLRIEDTRYEGGAHGMAAILYLSFDPASGRRLRLSDVAAGAGADSLRALGERAFRAARGLSAGADLGAAGFTWEGRGFVLPDNFGVTRAGLVFHWNPYDVAPYAAGPTTITLPWSAIKPHLKSDGPLAIGL